MPRQTCTKMRKIATKSLKQTLSSRLNEFLYLFVANPPVVLIFFWEILFCSSCFVFFGKKAPPIKYRK